jgi:hypothetical protein
VENLNSSQKIVRQKCLFFHTIVQAICFRKSVESLNSCQTIVRQKRLTGIEQTFFLKIDCGSKQFVKHLTWHFTGIRSAKMYTNCIHFFIVFVTKMPATKMLKKCLKKRGNFPQIACTFVKHLAHWHIPSEEKYLCRPIAASTQTIGLSGTSNTTKVSERYSERSGVKV